MKKLLIDAGNSSMKWAFLDNSQLSITHSHPYNNIQPIEVFKSVSKEALKTGLIDSIVVVSVLGDNFIRNAKKASSNYTIQFKSVKSTSQLAGITNAYENPQKLGADRFLAMIAAYNLMPNDSKKASIVVDSGTATTIDAIDDHGHHLGGVILSGLDLCSQNLLGSTKLLPLFIEKKDNFEPSVFSTNTKQAIASGSIFGLAGAINNICLDMEKRIQKTSNNFIVNKILTGGAAKTLHPYLSKDFHIHESLLMQGLKIFSEIENNQYDK